MPLRPTDYNDDAEHYDPDNAADWEEEYGIDRGDALEERYLEEERQEIYGDEWD